MKKIILIFAIIIGTSVLLVAQDFKPVAGQLAAEVNFTPLSTTPIGLNYLKARYNLGDGIVVRIGVDIRTHSEKSEPINEFDPDITDEQKMSYSQFGLYPGIEKHFGNLERLSPYVGAQIGFVTKSSKSSYTDNNADATTESKGAWLNGSNRGYTSIGLNLLAGVDFYFTRNLYLGTEIGFGFNSTTYKEVEVTMGSTTTTTDVKDSSSGIGFTYNPAIRLGFWF